MSLREWMESVQSSLLIATTNLGKLREVRDMLAGIPVELKSLTEFPQVPLAIEDGQTFLENACQKALHYARHTGLLTLADDSGLEVVALGGAPGVHSARYAGTPSSDVANNAKLIAALANEPLLQRTARFRCAIAVAKSDEILASSEGAVEGLIVDQPRGQNGFGYDPHFFLPALNKTAAELDPQEKNRISHRGKALIAIMPRLTELRQFRQ